MEIKKLNACWWALRIGLGMAAFLAGLDKFFNILTDWSMYLSPLAERFSPVGGKTLMLLIGPVEMLVGLAILTRWTRQGAYVAAAWLMAIAMNLVSTGQFYDLAVRDVELAIAAWVLAKLTEVLHVATERSATGELRLSSAALNVSGTRRS